MADGNAIAERATEHAKSSACLPMRCAAELDSAIDSIRGEIVKMNGDPRVPPRDKQMNEIQLNYAMKVLQRARDRWAEEAVKLWTSASQSPQAT